MWSEFPDLMYTGYITVCKYKVTAFITIDSLSKPLIPPPYAFQTWEWSVVRRYSDFRTLKWRLGAVAATTAPFPERLSSLFTSLSAAALDARRDGLNGFMVELSSLTLPIALARELARFVEMKKHCVVRRTTFFNRARILTHELS
jgi:hypothetical protein